MTISVDSPSEIYQKINNELIHIIESMTGESTDSELNNAQGEARKQLGKLQKDLKQQLADLQKNAEWDTFTIAFYGETGAGKSTLIETLRIILQEPTKRENQEKYYQLKSAYQLNLDSIEHLGFEVEKIDKSLELLRQQSSEILGNYKDKCQKVAHLIEENKIGLTENTKNLTNQLQQKEQTSLALSEATARLEIQIKKHKEELVLWQRVFSLVEKLPKDKFACAQTQQTLDGLKHEKCLLFDRKSKLDDAYESTQRRLKIKQKKAEQEVRMLNRKLGLLQARLELQKSEFAQHADGEIIGDGSADFTRETHRYDFNLKNNRFALLDVPGIEGKEDLVLKQIESAVQMAHAVFYVTNKASPPQTGDDDRKGTLEKIKDHLGAQTEVWSIFNKKVTNPKHTLKNRSLISEDEQVSLNGFDEKMREQLGKHYQEAFSLTALPAFLASTDCLVPGSQNAKRRAKFLQDFTEAELLERSRMQVFLEMLEKNLLPESKKKINRANLNKAKEAVDNTTDRLGDIGQTYSTLAENISETSESSKEQLNSSFEIMQTRLDRESINLVRQFVQNVRSNVYKRIEGDISNDSFKRVLDTHMENELKTISHNLPLVIRKETMRFLSDAEDIWLRFEEHTQDFTDAFERLGKTKLYQPFDIKIDIDNGINKVALLSALAGLALAPFTGGASAWVVGGAVLTAVIAVGKAVIGFFSTSYKQAQQKKSTNDNLRRIQDILESKSRDSLKKGRQGMQMTIKELELALEAPVVKMQETAKLLQNSNQKLKTLSREIQALGGL